MSDDDLRDRLANFIIVGVGKSGTSSMFAYLAEHPEICGSTVKETHFFDPVLRGDPLPPMSEYATYWSHAAGERYRLEATPLYCLGGDAMIDALERHLGPDLHVMIMLRDPVERLSQNFAYMKAKMALPGIDTFDQYVDRCLDLRARGLDVGPESEASSWTRSFYGDYLGPWFDRFGPQLRMVWFEDLAEYPEQTVAVTFSWLGLDPTPADSIDYRIHNRTTSARFAGLQRLAVSANRLAGEQLDRFPAVRRRLRDAYLRVNGRDATVTVVSPEARQRIEEALGDSNLRLAAMLTDAGYQRLPTWLVDAIGDTTPEPAR